MVVRIALGMVAVVMAMRKMIMKMMIVMMARG